jgi:hypothetical protein
MPVRGSWSAVVALAAGSAAFGVAVQLGRQALGPFAAAVWIGAPWLLVAFAIGAAVRRPAWAPVAGGAALAIATLSYYFVAAAHGSGLYAAAMSVAWGGTASIVGGAFGMAGAAWRSGRAQGRVAAIAGTVPGSAAAAEGVLLLGAWRGAGSTLVLLGEATFGVVLTAVHARRSAHVSLVLVAAVVLFLAFGLAEHQVRAVLHAVGWAGP